ncbi:DUF1553 domain-containing protein [Prosthecobacter sp.]|uniref:DUF1553 domain-containing protein n=1 Tax=Prosthecobacter sp. TaxID=1965333 RepID=UPI0024880132|nr:DUF1553 domain-containing protein [Prosthecobacter sp.]MDI1315400.1 DUF1553 domain-containing protein [Prosthecobacter sp.]
MVSTCLIMLLCCMRAASAGEARLGFNRDIRPILSNKCFRCHGFDEKGRKGDLRLDQRDDAIASRDGRQSIAPGKSEESELIQRISTTDADDIMPPPESKFSLTAEEKETLRRWIAEGAEYEAHWSLIPPKSASLPLVKKAEWPRTEIDRFVLARLEKEGMPPSPEAARETLLRRVSFDLTGLPPTLKEMDDYLHADPSAQAYEHAVDRLLASKHFGERMAVEWLDAARYADTNGYFGDKTRSLWPWRDWVIDAYNRNVRFDQFTIEQLAGDLIPNASTAQRIATGFNRNHMANNESGIIDEEYRVEYVADRLETTGTTWLGLTIGCARCHDHKYDPITQREFYQLFAFFNSVPESGLIKNDNPPPVLSVSSEQQTQELIRLSAAAQQAERDFQPVAAALKQQIAVWEKTAVAALAAAPTTQIIAHFSFDGQINAKHFGTRFVFQDAILGQSAKFDATQHAEWEGAFDTDAAWTVGLWVMADTSLSGVLSKIEPKSRRRGFEVIWQKGRFQINLVSKWGTDAIELVTQEPVSSKKWHHLVVSYDGSRRAGGMRVFIDGQPAATKAMNDTLRGSTACGEPLRIGRRDSSLGFYGQLDELRLLRRAITQEEAGAWFWSERLRGIVAMPAAKRIAADSTLLQDWFVEQHADAVTRAAHQRVREARAAEAGMRESIPTTLVMQEMPSPRKTHLLTRGQYDHPAEEVRPGVPASLSQWPTNAPPNRLGFAQWVVSKENPLTARVAVNRLWQQCFGEGLVRTVNDFGSQGEAPSHPELLDWLAVRFMQSGWDVKAMLKLMVMSATYRQSSAFSARDPSNLLLARGPSFRLSAEMVRDQALAVSGLLVPKIGGPSVKPYQPPGLWEAVSYNGEESYVTDTNDGLWRRSLYTFLKRQSPPPALLTFDGPTREKCTVRRARTNTPLQALVLLNDETYIEAARVLAAWTLGSKGSEVERLALVFRRVMCRRPEPEELKLLGDLLSRQRARFAADREAAMKLIAEGASTRGRDLDPVELAAWALTLHTLFNLDETITRR